MTDVFDILTVACFLVVAAAFFLWTGRDTRTLLHLTLCLIAFAVANELGRTGSQLLAYTLIAAGMAYALLIVVNAKRPDGGIG